MHEQVPATFIPEICLLVMEWIGGKEGFMMRTISKSWLLASQHFHSISMTFRNNSKILEHALMEHVGELFIFDNKLNVEQFKSLIVENSHLKNLRTLHLDLFGDEDGSQSLYLQDDISLVATSQVFCNLETLIISGHNMGNNGLIRIFTSSVLTKLKSLRLRWNTFQNFGALTNGTDKLTNLTELNLEEDVGDVQLLCRNQLFANLKVLCISSNVNENYFINFLSNPVWPRLEVLELGGYFLPDNVDNIKCSLKLKKLTINGGSLEKINMLVENKSISQSLTYLDVGITNAYSTDLTHFVSLFKEFYFIPKSYAIVDDDLY